MTIKTNIFFACAIVTATVSAQAADLKYAPKTTDWDVRVGAGLLYAPAFLGAKDYQLMAVPNVRVAYKDKFFASIQEGVGYNIINSDGWRVGPLARIGFGRDEDGDSTFRVAGAKTNALRGLGDVDTTLELGGFAEYGWQDFKAKVELLQGVNGHEGFISNLGVNYSKNIATAFYQKGPPIIVSFGPKATLVDGNYNQTFFGVNATQSANSGLPQYEAGGGLLSYGVGGSVTAPLKYGVSATFLARYERLAGDAGDSPLVSQRGSRNQAVAGVFLSYGFGFDSF